MIGRCSHIAGRPLRVFFAIFPNQAAQDQLTRQTELLEPICGGYKVKKTHLHLTLLFLGNVSIHRIEPLQEAMKAISEKEFEISLEVIGYWKKSLLSFINLMLGLKIRTSYLFDNPRNVVLVLGSNLYLGSIPTPPTTLQHLYDQAQRRPLVVL